MAVRREIDPEWGLEVYKWLRDDILTEEHTDTVAEVMGRVLGGAIPGPLDDELVKRAVDAALPEAGLKAIREILQRLGWLRDSDTFVDSPFA